MIAVWVNTATVLIGSALGLLFSHKINEKFTKAMVRINFLRVSVIRN